MTGTKRANTDRETQKVGITSMLNSKWRVNFFCQPKKSLETPEINTGAPGARLRQVLVALGHRNAKYNGHA